MKLKIVLLAFLSIPIFANSKFRNISILYDNNVEHVGNGNTFQAIGLYSALQLPSSAVLITTSLWRSVIERKQEFEQLSQLEGTDEYKVKCHYDFILEQINYWAAFFQEHTQDPFVIKQMIAQKINQDFCFQEAVAQLDEEKKLITKTKLDAILFQLFLYFTIDVSQWDVYSIDSFLLFLPKDGIYNDCFSLQNVKKLNDPYNLVQFDYDVQHDKFINILKNIFSPEQNFSWNVYASGHGANAEYAKEPLVINLPINIFQQFLEFLENDLSVNCFVYQSCYCNGTNAEKIYIHDGIPKTYPFPIVSICLSENVTRRSHILISKPSYGDQFFLSDFFYNAKTGQFEFKKYNRSNWDKFFSLLSKLEIKKDLFSKAKLIGRAIFSSNANDWIENIPMIRLAGSPIFSTFSNDYAFVIDPYLNAITTCFDLAKKNHVLFSSTCIKDIRVEKEKMPQIHSLLQGDGLHYITKLTVPNMCPPAALEGFFPYGNPIYKKTFLIDKVQLKNDPSQVYSKMINATKDQLEIFNVIITTQPSLLRFRFKTQDNAFFNGYMKLGDNNEPIIRSFLPLQVNKEKYLEEYESLKAQAEENYYLPQDFVQAYEEELKTKIEKG